MLGRCRTETHTPTPPALEPEEMVVSVAGRLCWELGISSLAHSFENFEQVPGAELAFKAFHDLAEGSGRPLLLCYGGPGNGKTHLLEALVIRLYQRGLFTRYFTWNGVVRELKRHLAKDADPSFDILLDRFCRAQRLVIDDLGAGVTDSEWELAQLETIVDWRYRYRLLTAMASNLDIKQLPNRIFSRFCDPAVSLLVLSTAGDYRVSRQERIT